MRKLLMMVAASVVLMGTTLTTKAVDLLKLNDVSIRQNNDNGLVLKHASQLFGNSKLLLAGHGSHGSHGSHVSHSSHSSHYSSR